MKIYEFFLHGFGFFEKQLFLAFYFTFLWPALTHLYKLNQMDHVRDQLSWNEVYSFLICTAVKVKCWGFLHSSYEDIAWTSKEV